MAKLIEHFDFFLKTTYSDAFIELTDDVKPLIMEDFDQYLKIVFKDKPEKVDELWSGIEPMIVRLYYFHPLYVRGYDPVFQLHFAQFLEETKKEVIKLEIEKGIRCPKCESDKVTDFKYIVVCGNCKHKWIPKKQKP